MFTHAGVLRDFRWSDVQPRLNRKFPNGGVLYISGLPKTRLATHLTENLRDLKEKFLICLDLGRVGPTTLDEETVAHLDEAFKCQLIDVHICTFRELWTFQRLAQHKTPGHPPRQSLSALQSVVKNRRLPTITYVRSEGPQGMNDAYAIVGEEITSLQSDSSGGHKAATVGLKNAFNAAVLFHLLSYGGHRKLPEFAVEVGKMAAQQGAT